MLLKNISMKYLCLALVLVITACSSNRYFIVRHAEKTVLTKDSASMMANNPPLSEAGKVRAFVLRDELKDQHIQYIFSTNTIRAIATAQPLNESRGNTRIEFYSSSKDSLDGFIEKLKSIKKGNVLVVGHANTVDDIVNKLCNSTKIPADLKDSDYDNLYIVKKNGKRMIFSQRKYGYPSAPEK
jgi:broad specificity phosphatase PhoE